MGCFFFLLDNIKESVKKTNQNISLDISGESLKIKEISSKNLYKTIKLENIRITSKQPTKKANHYRVNYRDKCQNSGFFFMDSYFRDKKEVIQVVQHAPDSGGIIQVAEAILTQLVEIHE